MPSSIAEAGYELSQNAISEQNERLRELRGRPTIEALSGRSSGSDRLRGTPDLLGEASVEGENASPLQQMT